MLYGGWITKEEIKMKKRILSLALVSSMAFGIIYSVPGEARSFKSFRKFKVQPTPIVEVQPEEENLSAQPSQPTVTEPTVTEPVVEEAIKNEEPQLGAEIDMAGDAINVVDFGAVANANYYNPSNGNYYTDASFTTPATDATEAINKAIKHASQNGIQKVVIPNGNYLIKTEGVSNGYVADYTLNGGIQLESNMTLEMSSGTTLVTNTVNKNGYSFITLNSKENVKIIGGKIVGDKDTHPANTHDYCYGITVADASRNVLIEGVEITKIEDDGIMIADYSRESGGGNRVSDVVVRNVKSHNNGRQGLTIASGSNIKILNSEFSNQTKHDPKSGIDIEIESYDHIGVKNIEISGNKFEGNAFSGVLFSNMFNDRPGSMSQNISINGNTISGSRHGILAEGKAEGLDMSNNNITVNNLNLSQSSVGVGTLSQESKNVVISGNVVNSDDTKVHSSTGVYSTTPATTISGNTLTGQNVAMMLSGSGEQVLNNKISKVLATGIHVSGSSQNIAGNEISISGKEHLSSDSYHNVIYAEYAENLSIKDNNFHDMRSYGINLADGVKNANISGNSMKNIGTEAFPNKNSFILVRDGNTGINVNGNTFDRGTYPTLFLGINYANSVKGANSFTNNQIIGFDEYGYGMYDGGFVFQGNTGI
jgi:hypothetical protein